MMRDMAYEKSSVVSLKSHPVLNEKWLQALIAADPTILGLGDLTVKEVERRQPRAGRLDLLLWDPEANTRYEVELQLGATDEAHIIRTIEYWDIEKSRYPQYEHVAVLVAEDITSRFLNVISLFNKTIPLIAIQIQALQVGEALTLSAVKVLDVTSLGTDEEDEPGQPTDRAYWEQKGSKQSVAVADGLLGLVNEVIPGHELKFNKHYIGLVRGGIVDNFVAIRPRKEHVIAEFRIPRSDELSARIDESGLDLLTFDTRLGCYRFRLSMADLTKQRPILLDLISIASGVPLRTEPQDEG